jgi:transcriptional regulator GlxA family with amidase domain
VDEICRASGFGYPANMTKVFREATGTTPSAYRREGRTNGPVTQ